MRLPTAFLALLLASASASLGEPASLQMTESRGTYHLLGRFTVASPPDVAWEVLTDYEGIARFVSSIRASKVVQRRAEGAVIEQEGTGRFLLIPRRVKLTLLVREERPSRIRFEDVEGTQFKRYDGSWRIEPSPSGCVVIYVLDAQPRPLLGPRFAAKRVLRASVARLLGEVRSEIERRTGCRGLAGPLRPNLAETR